MTDKEFSAAVVFVSLVVLTLASIATVIYHLFSMGAAK